MLRLQTDHIDLYYQHRTDPDIAPEEVAGVMSELMQELSLDVGMEMISHHRMISSGGATLRSVRDLEFQ